jgi:hypothetical protein
MIDAGRLRSRSQRVSNDTAVPESVYTIQKGKFESICFEIAALLSSRLDPTEIHRRQAHGEDAKFQDRVFYRSIPAFFRIQVSPSRTLSSDREARDLVTLRLATRAIYQLTWRVHVDL